MKSNPTENPEVPDRIAVWVEQFWSYHRTEHLYSELVPAGTPVDAHLFGTSPAITSLAINYYLVTDNECEINTLVILERTDEHPRVRWGMALSAGPDVRVWRIVKDD